MWNRLPTLVGSTVRLWASNYLVLALFLHIEGNRVKGLTDVRIRSKS